MVAAINYIEVTTRSLVRKNREIARGIVHVTSAHGHLGVGAAALAIAGLVTASPKVRKALFTREDVFNFHKTLGMSCLLSYAYRFAQLGDADMGFGPTVGTLGSIALHMTLSVSSLIFKIPRKRSVSLYRIWPEYRLHSIVFAWRCLLAMLITWAEAKLGLEPQYALNMAARARAWPPPK